MTHNQIEYAKLKESVRHNQATESQAKDELQQEYAKLNEAIRNNDLNYDVNQSKLYLAYQELDEKTRHNIAEEAATLKKIAEEARHNGVAENTTLQQLAEDARNHNLTYRSKLFDQLTTLSTKSGILSTLGVSQIAQALQLELELVLGQNKISSAYEKSWVQDDTSSITGTKSGKVPVQDPSNATRVSGFNTSQASTHSNNQKVSRNKKEENEIPSDFSSSKGPDNEVRSTTKSNDSNRVIITPSANSASTRIVSGSEHGKTSGGTNYSSSGGIRSSGTIYSGSMTSGPGVGL